MFLLHAHFHELYNAVCLMRQGSTIRAMGFRASFAYPRGTNGNAYSLCRAASTPIMDKDGPAGARALAETAPVDIYL